MVIHYHELGQSWVPEDGIVWQASVGDIEVNELGAVIVALPKGDRKANLPYWNLEIVECLDGQGVESSSTVDEGPGDLHVADDWGAKHREDSSCGRALELIR